jgi:lipopolysaccharide/colanic/teichoic acid biosynthesis glycosyltransferase
MKRLFDLLVILLGSPLWLPLLLAVAVLVKIKLGGPVFFTQPRPGKHGKVFNLVKFRSMTTAFDANGAPLPDALRLTPFGRALRASSLDELPELWNVLKGDMSLVGPRPLLVEYLPRYSPEQARRHDVRPGLTGLAQINGRNNLSWEERFRWDVHYVDNYCFWLDIKILALTLLKVISREGISSAGEATTTPFDPPRFQPGENTPRPPSARPPHDQLS